MARIVEPHLDKHHWAYADGANATLDTLVAARELNDFAALDAHFGSFGAFKAHLTQATTSVQGSGWAALR